MTIPVPLILNFVLFQAAWFAAVLAPPGIASFLAALALVIHLKWVALPREWRFILLVTVIGGAVDSIFAWSGVFAFPAATFGWQPPPAPLWLLLLWANFATTLCHSLQWMQRYKALAFVLGGVAGPLAYLGGVEISDKLEITLSPLQYFAVAAPCWAVVCLVLPQIARRVCGGSK